MSATWKGTLQLVLVSDNPVFDAETGLKYADRVWAGRQDVVYGFANELEQSGISYQVFDSPPVYSIAARIPLNSLETEVLDRYEISTEAHTLDLWQFPEVREYAQIHDLVLGDGEKTFRTLIEEAVTNEPGAITNYAVGSVPWKVLEAQRAGVTGYELDAVVLRRYRQIDLVYATAAGRIGLRDSGLIFSTAQLNLPDSVAFRAPETPGPVYPDSKANDSYAWGWRVRGQRVELVGNFAEQTIELTFAPWSLLFYRRASGALNW